MDRACKACGASNREDAKFCRSCGSPLPAVKPRDLAAEKRKAESERKFWTAAFIVIFIAGLAGYLIYTQYEGVSKVRVVSKYEQKFASADERVFVGISPTTFKFQGLSWGMTKEDIKKLYKYPNDSNDPDFEKSIMISQSEFLYPMPHANFLSLGMHNGRIYAFKMEYGENESFQNQTLKVPDKEEILYGRFMGICAVFKKMFGAPSFEKNDVKNMELVKKLAVIKGGVLGDGQPSNIYLRWNVGVTRIEAAFFGFNKELHLTVRFLNGPLWDEVEALKAGKLKGF